MTVGKPKETAKTLRDDIAIAVLRGMPIPMWQQPIDLETADRAATIAYAYADAMLRARLKGR
jgi:hypothetical protein